MIPELVPEDWAIFAPGSPCPLEVARLVEAQHLWRRATAPISCDVMQTLRVLVRLLRLREGLEAMRKIAAPTPSPSSPALAMVQVTPSGRSDWLEGLPADRECDRKCRDGRATLPMRGRASSGKDEHLRFVGEQLGNLLPQGSGDLAHRRFQAANADRSRETIEMYRFALKFDEGCERYGWLARLGDCHIELALQPVCGEGDE